MTDQTMSSLSKPINLEEFTLAIKDLSDSELTNIKKQISNSIQKLQTSNELMSQQLDEINLKLTDAKNEDLYQESNLIIDLQKDVDLYSESINENKLVLQNQNERLDVLQSELSNRGLSHAHSVNTNITTTNDITSHYPEISQVTNNDVTISQDNDDMKNGIYL